MTGVAIKQEIDKKSSKQAKMSLPKLTNGLHLKV